MRCAEAIREEPSANRHLGASPCRTDLTELRGVSAGRAGRGRLLQRLLYIQRWLEIPELPPRI